MANFADHIQQAKNNLSFLEQINNQVNGHWDWQVTVAFYSAVHLVNAHIATKLNKHYRTHNDVNNALNPFSELSLTKLDEETYTSYIKLQNLARRARYLCHEKNKERGEQAFFTHDKHFSKAIKHLEKLMTFLSLEYNTISFEKINISCIEFNNWSSNFFFINGPKVADT